MCLPFLPGSSGPRQFPHPKQLRSRPFRRQDHAPRPPLVSKDGCNSQHLTTKQMTEINTAEYIYLSKNNTESAIQVAST